MKNSLSSRRFPQRFRFPHSPIACYVTDRSAFSDAIFLKRIERSLAAGVDLIQLREKTAPTDELIRLSEQILAFPRRREQKIVINDRLDIALACGFDGVHLSGTSFPLVTVRRRVPKDFIIGVSTHHLSEAMAAERAGADYVIFGPIFPTPSKMKYGPPEGVERLAEVTQALSIPVLAIGGISLDNFRECLDVGAAGIAAISLFQKTPNIRSIVSRLRHPTSNW